MDGVSVNAEALATMARHTKGTARVIGDLHYQPHGEDAQNGASGGMY
jgi:hypothetical protein